MPVLELSYLDNTVAAWLMGLGAGALAFTVLELLKTLGRRQLKRRLKAVEPVDDAQPGAGPVSAVAAATDSLVLRLISGTKLFFIALISVYFASLWLVLPEHIASFIGTLVVVGIAAQVGIWGNIAIAHAIARGVERRMAHDAAAATTLNAVGFISRLFLWVLLFLMVLANLEYEITPLLAGLGVGGIAVALAVQNVLGDLFGSLSIVLDKPFVIGDFIIVGELLGTVEYIGLKTTRIRSLSGEQIVFSNSDLLNSRIRNFKRMYHRRVVFGFGVTYETPYDKLAAIPAMVREIVEDQDTTRFDRAHFHKYGDFSLDFEVVYHVLDPDYNVYMDIQQAINLELYRRFEAEDIDFAYPTRTIYMHEQDRSASGARAEARPVAAGRAGD